jgi:hypothetical protein
MEYNKAWVIPLLNSVKNRFPDLMKTKSSGKVVKTMYQSKKVCMSWLAGTWSSANWKLTWSDDISSQDIYTSVIVPLIDRRWSESWEIGSYESHN